MKFCLYPKIRSRWAKVLVYDGNTFASSLQDHYNCTVLCLLMYMWQKLKHTIDTKGHYFNWKNSFWFCIRIDFNYFDVRVKIIDLISIKIIKQFQGRYIWLTNSKNIWFSMITLRWINNVEMYSLEKGRKDIHTEEFLELKKREKNPIFGIGKILSLERIKVQAFILSI